MERKVMIGTVKLDRDTEMFNSSFSYAADFERMKVKAGEYPIYAYASDLETVNGKKRLGWRNYIGYAGEVIDNSFGDEPGTPTVYRLMLYDYELAEHFLDGFDYIGTTRCEYTLRPEWNITIRDFEYDGKREFTLRVELKDGAELTYAE